MDYPPETQMTKKEKQEKIEELCEIYAEAMENFQKYFESRKKRLKEKNGDKEAQKSEET